MARKVLCKTVAIASNESKKKELLLASCDFHSVSGVDVVRDIAFSRSVKECPAEY